MCLGFCDFFSCFGVQINFRDQSEILGEQLRPKNMRSNQLSQNLANMWPMWPKKFRPFLSKGWLNLWAKYSGPEKTIAIFLFLSELKELEVRNQNAEFSFGFWSWSLFRKLKLRQDFKTAFWPSLFSWSLLKYGNVYVLIGKFSESPSSWNTLLITVITGCNDFSFPQSSQK